MIQRCGNRLSKSLSPGPTVRLDASGSSTSALWIRLQVSGGAHPLFARNTCSGEPLADAVVLVVAHNKVHHSEAYPSTLDLPVMA